MNEARPGREPPAGRPRLLRLPLLGAVAVVAAGLAGLPAAGAARPPRVHALVQPASRGEGVWAPTGRRPRGGPPIVYETSLRYDAGQPWLVAGLLRIDMRRARLHLAAGTDEPRSQTGLRGGGAIPTASYGSLLAAFNGGFKTAAGPFGFMADGVSYSAPVQNLGTLIIWKTGGVKIGVFGRDITGLHGVAALRQNLPLLVDGGRPSPDAGRWQAWGATLGNVVSVARSAVGVARNGDLIVGDAVSTPAQLARVMVAAGAVRALELDINPWWVDTYVYGAPGAGGMPVPHKLLPGMLRSDYRFLTPDSRDFFYVLSSLPLVA